jgi:ADP-ribosylarginine hydrolase
MEPSLLEKYEASMLLHAVGDAMGYYNGKWEFKFSGLDIHEDLKKMGGVESLKLNPSAF